MLTMVKLALRISTNAFDSEISQYINDCLYELVSIGIIPEADATKVTDPMVVSCVIFYCKAYFGNNPDAEKWKTMYSEKVGRLRNTSGYGLHVAESEEDDETEEDGGEDDGSV